MELDPNTRMEELVIYFLIRDGFQENPQKGWGEEKFGKSWNLTQKLSFLVKHAQNYDEYRFWVAIFKRKLEFGSKM